MESETISETVLARMLTEQGLPTTTEDARRHYRGKRLSDITDSAEQALESKLPATWGKDFERQRGEALVRSLKAAPEVAYVISTLQDAGIDTCVAATTSITTVRLSLAVTHLRPLFEDDTLFTAETVAKSKPHPGLFAAIANARGADPKWTAVLDATPAGVKAAKKARMRALGYSPGGEVKALRTAGATDVLLSLEELPDLLGL